MTMKDGVDLAAASGIFASLVGWLPEIAAGLAVIWGIIRIYEWARVRIFKKTPDLKL